MVLVDDPLERAAAVVEAATNAVEPAGLAGTAVAVYVHGSVLLDRFHTGSDIDLAVLFAAGVSWQRRLDLLGRLETAVEAATGHPADAQELPSEAYSVFGDVVSRTGRLAWVGDRGVHGAWHAMIDSTRPPEYTLRGMWATLRRLARSDHALPH